MTMYDPNQPMGGDRPPQIRFDAIGEAWNLVRANLGTWVLITLVYVVCVLVIEAVVEGILGMAGMGIIGQMRHRGADAPIPSPGASLTSMAASMIGSLVIMAGSAFFFGGYFRAALKQVRGEAISVGDLFTCSDVLGALIVGMLLYGFSVEFGFVLCIVPGVFLMGALMFMLPLIIDKRMSALDAMRLSWDTLKGQAWAAFGFYFVAALVSELGALLCGVGVLVTAPIMFVALAIVYRDFFGGGFPMTPQIQMPMPPPTAISNSDV